MNRSITIYEEETNLFWGVIVVASTALGTIILGDAFVDDSLLTIGYRQLASIGLFMLAFLGILKITDPLFRFVLTVEGDMLTIETYKGELPIKTFYYNLREFAELRFTRKGKYDSDEALFDFSPSYQMVFKSHITGRYEPLIDLGDLTFTLRVPDIAKVIRFIREHDRKIALPDEQAAFLESR